MDFKYKWKNGARPTRDEAARSQYLLDESQFDNENDRSLAEETARKHLNVPTQTLDSQSPVLPQAAPPD
ncbi:MAG TPA: bromodomain-containing protein [Allocoleopsis sp.]